MSELRNVESVHPKDIGFLLTKPCGDCPFRKDAPLHEGILKSTKDFFDAIDARTFLFSCHKTDPRADAKGTHIHGKAHHCAGALILQKNMGVLGKNKSLRLASRWGFTFNRIKKSAAVFSGPYEMLTHYLKLYKKEHPEQMSRVLRAMESQGHYDEGGILG